MLPTEVENADFLMTYVAIFILFAAVVLMGFLFDFIMERWDA